MKVIKTTPKYVDETVCILSMVIYDISTSIDVDIDGKTIIVKTPMDYVNEVQSLLDDFEKSEFLKYDEDSGEDWGETTEEFYIDINRQKYKKFIKVLEEDY